MGDAVVVWFRWWKWWRCAPSTDGQHVIDCGWRQKKSGRGRVERTYSGMQFSLRYRASYSVSSTAVVSFLSPVTYVRKYVVFVLCISEVQQVSYIL